jgi:hypothetical protein
VRFIARVRKFHQLVMERLHFSVLFGSIECVHRGAIESPEKIDNCAALLSGDLKETVSLTMEILSGGTPALSKALNDVCTDSPCHWARIKHDEAEEE